MKQKGSDSEVRHQAAEWFLLMHSAQVLTEDQYVAYIHWLKQSPLHEQLMADCENLWDMMGMLEGEPEFQAYTEGGEHPAGGRRKKVPVLVKRFAAVAASAVLFAMVTIGLMYAAVHSAALQLRRDPNLYQTATGEQQTVELRDGSRVVLNTATELHVRYSREERRVFLERGEALFDVFRDPERPFIVYAAGGEIQALGTRFNVRVQHADVVVSLVEGEVKVNARSRENGVIHQGARVLHAGQQTRYSPAGGIAALEEVDTEQVVQWQTRQLSFNDMPLEQIVAEINRYTPVKLTVTDAAMGSKRLSAYFLIDNLESFLTALDKLYGIKARRDAGVVLLFSKEQVQENQQR